MKWTKQRLNNLFFLIGVVAVVVMMLTFDVSFIELWEHLCHAGYWLIPILGVWKLISALSSLEETATTKPDSCPGGQRCIHPAGMAASGEGYFHPLPLPG